MNFPCRALLLALTLLAPAVASAEITITSSLNNYRITVIDLKPDDGVAAGWQYMLARSAFAVGDELVSRPYSAQPSQAPFHQVHDSFYHQSVDSSGFNQAELVTTFANPGQQYPQQPGAATVEFESRILMAPHTRLVVEVDLLSTTSSTGGDHFLLGGGLYASLSGLWASDNTGYDRVYQDGEEEHRVLSITLDNQTSSSLTERIILRASNSIALATPVPEPASYLMLGLGLGVLTLRRHLGRRSLSFE